MQRHPRYISQAIPARWSGGRVGVKRTRTVAARLFERGAAEDQIGEVLGISEMKSVRELLPKLRQPLQSIVRELV
jgi:hypothetical protein